VTHNQLKPLFQETEIRSKYSEP